MMSPCIVAELNSTILHFMQNILLLLIAIIIEDIDLSVCLLIGKPNVLKFWFIYDEHPASCFSKRMFPTESELPWYF